MKDVRVIEQLADVAFTSISFSHLLDKNHFKLDEPLQSSIHPVSLSGHQRDQFWQLGIHQSGFRDELLPLPLEEQAKQLIQTVVVDYIQRLSQSKDTDFIYHPQLWLSLEIRKGQLQVLTRELK
ncbi:hypothetical protein GCM10027185_60440 [Spirosoma pulveris]